MFKSNNWSYSKTDYSVQWFELVYISGQSFTLTLKNPGSFLNTVCLFTCICMIEYLSSVQIKVKKNVSNID